MTHLLRFLFAVATLGSGSATALSAPNPPDIVIFMVDDLGWNHIGAKLGTMGTAKQIYQTPNLAKMEAQDTSPPNILPA